MPYATASGTRWVFCEGFGRSIAHRSGDWKQGGDPETAPHPQAAVSTTRAADLKGVKTLIDTLSERQILALWRVATSMKPSETLTPEEAARRDQALREIESGEFVDWQDLKRAL